MGLTLVTGPSVEPLTLQEAKDHVRQDIAADDALITEAIKAARRYVENATGKALISQAWRLQRDTFPSYSGAIRLHRAPLIAVQSLKYYDEAEIEQTLSSSDYVVDTSATYGEIAIGYGLSWPATLYRRNAVTVNFTAGFGTTAAEIPAEYKWAVRLALGDFYMNREGQLIANMVENRALRALLDQCSLPLIA
jgi:uncharacterized phiE125 gp8 family phage protein